MSPRPTAASRTVRAVIFDLDGTLADTFKLIVSAWNAALEPHLGRRFTDAEVISRFGIPDPQMIRRELADTSGVDAEIGDRAVEDYHAHYEQRHREFVQPFAGVTEMLEALRGRSVPLGVMTGKGRRSATITLAALGWDAIFSAVVTGEDVQRQKPEPDGPLAAARMLDVAPEHCAFVGDSPADIGAGKAARMLTVAAGWHPVYLDEIRRLEPDLWADTPADVLQVIDG